MIIHFPWTHSCSTKFCRLPQKGKMGYEVVTIAAGSCVHQPGFESFQAPDFARTNVVALARETWRVAWEKPGCLFFRVDWWLVKSYDMARSDIYLNLSDEMLLVLKSAEDLSQGDAPQIPNDFPNNFLWHPVDHFFFISVNHWIRLASMEYQWISVIEHQQHP